MRPNKHNERGHVELGLTLALFVIMGFIGWMVFKSGGKPIALWLSWPWWAKVLSIVGPIFILLIGQIFENSRQWPKL